MPQCFVVDSNSNLKASTAVPCDGLYLLETSDIENQLSAVEVSLIFGAAASLYALVFVFKLALKQLGY